MAKRTTKSQRASIRRVGGPLKTVKDKRKSLYDFSLRTFVQWALLHLVWPSANEDLDSAVCAFILVAWQEGETRALVANLLSAIGDTEPSLRLWLHGARRLHQAWVKRELGGRCCPMSRWMARAIAGVLLWWKKERQSFVVALGHHGILRTMEALNAHVGDFTLRVPLGSGYLNLPDTKTSTRHGRAEAVTLEDPELVAWASKLCEGKAPGERICPVSAAAMRRDFAAAVQVLGWSNLDLQLYSMRRGGATEHFRQGNSMAATTMRGRWANFTTCKLYVDAALQDRASLDMQHRAKARKANAFLSKFLASLVR